MSYYFVYILQCADNTYYTGITTDMKRRLKEHNGKVKGGAKYTRVRTPVKLVY
ncbi:MAG: GIY-YIG nuclease family protein, partial [Candidatus Roizmanbacteria bacterium]|nr:GIY-YIG nuclease family protein [Candidatus Roizmanbacteria bacterium]